jgi:guanylate kinase
VFIAPPSLEALEARLRRRGSDAPEQIRDRLAVAPRELAAQEEFSRVVVNDDLERAIRELEQLTATMVRPP